MWSEALFPLLCIEWQAAAEALSSSKPSTSTRGLSAAETLMAGPAQYPPRPSLAAAASGGTGGAAAAAVAQMMGLSSSGSSALHAHLSIQVRSHPIASSSSKHTI